VRTRILLVVALLIVVALLLFVPVVAAQVHGSDCRNLVINRTYAGNFSGYLNLPAYMNTADNGSIGVVPNAGAGKISFLPGGQVVNPETIVIGLLGLHKDAVITGTYELVWDMTKKPALCVGAIHESDGSTPYDFQLLVTSSGDRIEMIHTNTGLIVGTSMFPMAPGNCHEMSIKGAYTYNSTGWALATPGTPPDQTLSAYTPGAMSGAMNFNPHSAPDLALFPDAPLGAGSVNGWDLLSANGAILTRSMKGWYNVNPDCSVNIVVVDNIGYPPFHIQGFIGRGASTIYAVNIDTLDLNTGPVPMFLMPITLTRNDDER
jgi:hypothetical protein